MGGFSKAADAILAGGALAGAAFIGSEIVDDAQKNAAFDAEQDALTADIEKLKEG